MDIVIELAWAPLLLIMIPAGIYLKGKNTPYTAFSCVALFHDIPRPSFFKVHAATCACVGTIASAVFALANPQYSSHWKKVVMESRWIMIVQDLSGSMNRTGGDESGLTLGDIALEGAKAFIDLRGQDDLIGLVGFSSYAKLICPPTFDKAILTKKLELLKRGSDSMVFRELTSGGGTNASYAAWIALCAFLMLVPEDHQPNYEELLALRHSLLGKSEPVMAIPEKLKQISFGQGMAIVLFTDGRIEAGNQQEDIRKGLPNFVNVIHLLHQLNVRLYLIVVSSEIDPDVRAALEESETDGSRSRIFFMPGRFDSQKINAVYTQIHEMEKNQFMVRWEKHQKQTRNAFTWASLCFLAVFWGIRFSQGPKHL
jgi:hypothetical protein